MTLRDSLVSHRVTLVGIEWIGVHGKPGSYLPEADVTTRLRNARPAIAPSNPEGQAPECRARPPIGRIVSGPTLGRLGGHLDPRPKELVALVGVDLVPQDDCDDRELEGGEKAQPLLGR